MRHSRRSAVRLLAFGAALVGLCTWGGEATAQGPRYTGLVYGDNAVLTVAVLPLHAEVRLDGVLLGTAHQLVARTMAMLPGNHLVQVSAPGYLPSVVRVPSEPNWASHVNLELVPARGN